MIIVFLIVYFLISLFMYLVIVGGNKNKSEYEKMTEDAEQLEYIESYKKELEDKKINGKNFYRKRR